MASAPPKIIRNNFNAGEISPFVVGRIDQERYYNALTTCENWIPLVQGGIQVRPGLIYAGAVKPTGGRPRLIPFVFAAGDQGVMEFGNQYIRFWKFDATTGLPVQVTDGGGTPIEVTTTYTTAELRSIQYRQSGDVVFLAHGNHAPAALSRLSADYKTWSFADISFSPPPTYEGKTDFATAVTLTVAVSGAADNGVGLIRITTATPHHLSTGWTVTITGVVGTTEANGTWVVTVIDATHFDLQGSAFVNAYVSGGTVFGHVWTVTVDKFLAGDVGRVIKTSDGARVSITDFIDARNVHVQDILAPPATSYTSGNWWLEGSPSSVLYPSIAGPKGAIALLTAKASVGGGTQDAFRSTDVGKYVIILGGVLHITSFVNATQVYAQILNTLTNWTSTVNYALGGEWTLEQPIWTASLGYPQVISLHQQRLLFGNSTAEPDTIRGSQIGDYFNFGTGLVDSSALEFVMATGAVCPIQWMEPVQALAVGTLSRGFFLGDRQGTPITPTSPKISPQNSAGANLIAPVVLENSLLFIVRGQRSVGEWLYNVLTDIAEVSDLLEYANHLTIDVASDGDRIFLENAAQTQPMPIAWYVRPDGTLCGLVYRRKQNVAAWFRVTTWRGTTQDVIESVAVIQNPVTFKDQAWLAINRGGTRSIEVMDAIPNPDRHMDASVKYSGPATSTITGLAHLNGLSVGIRGKDAGGTWRLYPNQTVAGGQVTGLNPTVVEAEVGLVFPATATVPPAEFPGAQTIQGKPKSYGLMQVRTYDTPSLKIQSVRYPNDGYSASAVYVIPSSGIPPLGPLSPAKDWADFELATIGVDRLAQVTFVQDIPLGGTVLMFCADLDVGA